MIAYGQCWEDPDTVRKALRITPEDDVLAITSGGCNVLALILDQPRSITAVDVNPAQNHLLELKRASIAHLAADEVHQFLGARPSVDRPALYQTLSNALSPSARSFWDAHANQIVRGIIHSGRFERYLQVFRDRVLPLVHHRRDVSELVRPKSLEQQRLFYDQVWNTYRWRAVVRLFFSRGLLSRFGRHPGAFKHARVQDVSGCYLRRARHALRDIPVATNYFLQYMATGQYRTALPAYLDSSGWESLRSHNSATFIGYGRRPYVSTRSFSQYLQQVLLLGCIRVV